MQTKRGADLPSRDNASCDPFLEIQTAFRVLHFLPFLLLHPPPPRLPLPHFLRLLLFFFSFSTYPPYSSFLLIFFSQPFPQLPLPPNPLSSSSSSFFSSSSLFLHLLLIFLLLLLLFFHLFSTSSFLRIPFLLLPQSSHPSLLLSSPFPPHTVLHYFVVKPEGDKKCIFDYFD